MNLLLVQMLKFFFYLLIVMLNNNSVVLLNEKPLMPSRKREPLSRLQSTIYQYFFPILRSILNQILGFSKPSQEIIADNSFSWIFKNVFA